MLNWWLKKVKDLILKFSINFFSENEFLNLYTMTLASFPSGGCVNEAVGDRANFQRYNYVYFLRYHTLTVISLIISEGVC